MTGIEAKCRCRRHAVHFALYLRASMRMKRVMVLLCVRGQLSFRLRAMDGSGLCRWLHARRNLALKRVCASIPWQMTESYTTLNAFHRPLPPCVALLGRRLLAANPEDAPPNPEIKQRAGSGHTPTRLEHDGRNQCGSSRTDDSCCGGRNVEFQLVSTHKQYVVNWSETFKRKRAAGQPWNPQEGKHSRHVNVHGYSVTKGQLIRLFAGAVQKCRY